MINVRETARRRLLPGVTCAAMAATGLLVAPGVAHADTQASHFVWTATSSSLSGITTEITNGATNGEPGALLFVTPNFDAGGVGGVYDNSPVGVYYDTSSNQWTIFNENDTAIPVGAEFDVLVVPAATSDAFTVTATSSNITGDSVLINSSVTNGAPDDVLQATQVSDGGLNDHVAGVWYDTGDGEAAVFNEGGAAMEDGSTYNVLVGATDGGKTALLRGNATNIGAAGGSAVSLGTNTTTAGDSNAFILDTPNWNPDGSCSKACVYDTSGTGASYFPSQWNIFNESQKQMKPKTDFNLLLWNS
jgi:hypothetical protein